MLRAMAGSKRAPDRDLLLAQHRFPGEYVIKVFGPNDASFVDAAHAAAASVVGARIGSSTRTSSGEKKVCVTLVLDVENVDEVIGVYERLYDLQGLQLIF